MKPWQPGDPIGTGKVYLPDEASKAAYFEACKREIVASAAKRVMQGSSVTKRRELLAQTPAPIREDVKAQVQRLWYQQGSKHGQSVSGQY